MPFQRMILYSSYIHLVIRSRKKIDLERGVAMKEAEE